MNARSLEFRAAALFSALLMAGLAAAGGVLWAGMRYHGVAAVDKLLEERAAGLANLLTAEFAEVEAEGEEPWGPEMRESIEEYASALSDRRLIQLRTANGESLLPAGQPLVPWQEGAGFFTAEGAEGPYRVLARDLKMPTGTYRVQISTSLAPLEAVRKGLLLWMLWAAPVAVLVGMGGGLLVSRAALRPLDAFAKVASRISAQRLSERLPAPETGDAVEQLARTFNGMLERLESSVRRLEEFTADASHELRGPVSVIRTTAELALRQGREGTALRGDLIEIQHEAERLTELIEDLLTLARADGGHVGLEMDGVDLTEVAAAVAERFRRETGAARIVAELDAGSRLVRGHAASLRRLLVILVENALRHNPEGTTVRIAVRGDGKRVTASVADDGQGIAAAELPRLFDRFYRGDASRSRARGSAGLGLSIAKWIVESHGGEISVSSCVGEGSVFRVSLEALG